MTLQAFIRANRAELDAIIRARLGRPEQKLNDSDRADWIANDEGLYNWARSNRVHV